MKKLSLVWLSVCLLLAIIVVAGVNPFPAKADSAGITNTPTAPVQLTATPTDPPPTEPPADTATPTGPPVEPPADTVTPTEPPVEPPVSTATPTATNTEPPPPTSPPSKPKPSNTPEPLLPETGETPLDPFQSGGPVLIAALAMLGLALGLVIGLRFGTDRRTEK
jgi:hypothetical protein